MATSALKAKLPFEKTHEEYAKRVQMWRSFDSNGNGYLSLDEVQGAIDRKFGHDKEWTQICGSDVKPAVLQAFNAAKFWRPSDPKGPGSDYVTKKEFRILLQCLYYYLQLLNMFDKNDANQDGELTADEFKQGLPMLRNWGVNVDYDTADSVFAAVDGNSGGKVLFADFCSWALKTRQCDTCDDDEFLKELNAQGRVLKDFKRWDLNNDGTITRDELWSAFSRVSDATVTQAEVDQLLSAADANNDGKIDYKEFVVWLFGGGKQTNTVSEAFVKVALQQRGITDTRILDGLMLAFDHDNSGNLSSEEFADMIAHVDKIMADDAVPDDTPPDCKAFIRLADTKNGPYEEPGNPKLKMLLTSAGIMPKSTQDLKDSFNKLKAKTSGRGVMFLVDARMVKLQFHLLNADPEKHNHQSSVPYRREPDAPGGKPVYDDQEKLVMKTQEELMNMGQEGYAGVPYNLRKRGHYANGHLDIFAGETGETPIYVAYLWYSGEVVDGKPQYKIFVGRGVYENGTFTAYTTTGKDFTEEDYNTPCLYSNDGDHFFQETEDWEWRQLMGSVQVVYGTGGIPFIPMLHFQPHFVDGGSQLKTENPYGKALLDNIKDGQVLYVGMSAGSMSFGWSLGPLTSDPDKFMLYDGEGGDQDAVDLGQDSELGKIWLFPGLGKYVGIPYDLTLKVHVHFDAAKCSYGGTAHKAEKVAQVVSAIAHKDKYCALLSDYDWYAGQGDALEVVDGRIFYHVGYSDGMDAAPADLLPALQKLGLQGDKLPRQPPGNPVEGFHFEWKPSNGEIIAAGPKSNRPFHMYASSDGPMPDAHPAYPMCVTVDDSYYEAQMRKRGITEPRILEGLLLAFDHDDSGCLSSKELDEMLNHVDDIMRQDDEPDEVPPDCKAFIRLADTGKGPFYKPGNKNLKMFLTSAGIMPKSTQDLKDSLGRLRDQTKGNGVMYLVDARLSTLQFHLLNADPQKHNEKKNVAYRRNPDAPGGEPVYADGKLCMKTQNELMNMGPEGYAGVPYNLRHRGHYANGAINELAGGKDCQVYVAYLWYNGKVVNGEPEYGIFLGSGEFKDGKFVAFRSQDGGEFTEEDYDHPCEYGDQGDHFFKKITGDDFESKISSVQVVYATGGIPYLPIMHFQPYFVDNGKQMKNKPNPYGKAILDNVKAGNITYMGMSAGAMAWGWSLGPLTSDPDSFMLCDDRNDEADPVDFGDNELGKFWLFPGLGEYVGIPHDITLKVHVHFDVNQCSYGGTAEKAEKVAKIISGIAHQDKYCALMADYDWYAGQGDALEVVNGGLVYHVGYCDTVEAVAPEVIPQLQACGYQDTTLPRQPPKNSPNGWSFKWNPKKGEVIAAGPKAKHPFHMYASSSGPMPGYHPAYPQGAELNDEFVMNMISARGLKDTRVVEALTLAFDTDNSGQLNQVEFDHMIDHVDQILEEDTDEEDAPPDAKAFIRLADTRKGPLETPGNPKLKMLLTSSGIMPKSTQDLKDTLERMKASTSGDGMLYLVDARMPKLQFHLQNADPSKHNHAHSVAYHRNPDRPGGRPMYDKSGNLQMKTQEELMNMDEEGYAGVPYNLRHRLHYANGHLESFIGGGGTKPVYVAFLWYTGEVVNGEPKYQIMLGKGKYENGTFTAFHTSGRDFTQEDYDTPALYSNEPDHFFAEINGDEFGKVISSVQVVYATGGIPYLPIMHFQPYFVDGGRQMLDKPNPYGKAILDNVKDGNIVYVGMSAGAMAWGWSLGPLTSDPDKFMLLDADDGGLENVDFGQNSELGKIWLFPGLGKYVGIPYEITLKVHVHFNAAKLSYGGTAHKAEKVAKVISGVAKQDMYSALLSDYDWYAGQGDALEICDGKLFYHVGYCDRVDPLPNKATEKLKSLGFTESASLPRIPPGNPAEGWSFEWKPADGEVIAAGPKATKKPFHMYASSEGPLCDAHPAYPES